MCYRKDYSDHREDDAVERAAKKHYFDMVRRLARVETLTALSGIDPDEDFCAQVDEMIKSWESDGFCEQADEAIAKWKGKVSA